MGKRQFKLNLITIIQISFYFSNSHHISLFEPHLPGKYQASESLTCVNKAHNTSSSEMSPDTKSLENLLKVIGSRRGIDRENCLSENDVGVLRLKALCCSRAKR